MFRPGGAFFDEETLKALSDAAARVDVASAPNEAGRRAVQRRNMAAFEAAQAAAAQRFLDLFEAQVGATRAGLDAALAEIEAISPGADDALRAAIGSRAYLSAIEGAEGLRAAAARAQEQAMAPIVKPTAARRKAKT